jgi:hypothetical protein
MAEYRLATFEEFKEVIHNTLESVVCTWWDASTQKKTPLYPFTYMLLQKNKRTTAEQHAEHLQGVEELYHRYNKPPIVEAVIGFEFYLAHLLKAVDGYRKTDPPRIKTPCERSEYESTANSDNGPYQPVYDVTDEKGDFGEKANLKKSIRKCRNFDNAIKQGIAEKKDIRMYAFSGPRVNKWKAGEDGRLLRTSGKPQPVMDFSNQMIFFYGLCAPYVSPSNPGCRYDLRFVSDFEILDVTNDLKEEKGKQYRRQIAGKEPGDYGVYLDELAAVREQMGLHKEGREKDAVYYLLAEKGKGAAAARQLATLHNGVLDKGLYKGLFHESAEEFHDRLLNGHNASFDDPIESMTALEIVTGILKNVAHDRVPHSYVAAMIKSGEFKSLLASLVAGKEDFFEKAVGGETFEIGGDLTVSRYLSLKGFKIHDPGRVPERFIDKKGHELLSSFINEVVEDKVRQIDEP